MRFSSRLRRFRASCVTPGLRHRVLGAGGVDPLYVSLVIVGVFSTACAGAAVSAAIPVVRATASAVHATRSDSQLPPAARVVSDAGAAWQREFLFTDGTPYDERLARSQDALRVRWTIPLELRGDVRAILGVAPRSCLGATTSPPDEWQVTSRGATSEPIQGEAWLLSRGATESSERRARRLGLRSGLQLASELGLSAAAEPAWLIIVPAAGAYRLSVTWNGADLESLAAVQPCIAGWTGIPLDVALRATMANTVRATGASGQRDRSAAPSPAIDTRGTQPHARDSVLSLGDMTRRSEPSASVDRRLDQAPGGASIPQASRAVAGAGEPSTIPSAVTADRLATALGFTERPEYNVLRLHALALEYEADRQSPGGLDDPSAALAIVRIVGAGEVARQMRDQQLRALALLPAATIARFCVAADRQGALSRPLRLWRDAPTVPALLGASSGSAGASTRGPLC